MWLEIYILAAFNVLVSAFLPYLIVGFMLLGLHAYFCILS